MSERKKTKRLDEKTLDACIEGVSGRFISLAGDLALSVLCEVKERRRADLSDDDRKALQRGIALVSSAALSSVAYEMTRADLIRVVTKLLAPKETP